MSDNILNKKTGDTLPGNVISGISVPLTVTYKGKLSGKDALILESFGEKDAFLVTVIGDELKVSNKFADSVNTKKANFRGHTVQKLLDSGRDLLAEELLSKDFCLEDLKGILPSSFSNGYISLGYHTSPRLFTVDKQARIFFQPDFKVERPRSEAPAFEPSEISPLGKLTPKISYIDGVIPILFCCHSNGTEALETMYLVEHGDSDFEYSVFIRAAEIKDDKIISVRYINAGCCNLKKSLPLIPDVFYNSLLGVIGYYHEMMDIQSFIDIPDKELERVYYGTMMTANNMMNGFQPKYGNMFYGLETHNNFPPNFIMAFSVFAMCGFKKKARLILEQFLNNAIDPYGRIIYRQGETQYYSYSGSEIGQLL